MTKIKKIMRIVSKLLACFIIVLNTIKLYLGQLTPGKEIVLYMLYALMVILLGVSVYEKIRYYEVFKLYKRSYDYLNFIYKKKYKTYFSGDIEERDRCSKYIKELSDAIFEVGKYLINAEIASKSQKEEVRIILDNTRKLLKKEFVSQNEII